MEGYPHPFTGAEATGVTLLPVVARSPVVEEVRVNVDERRLGDESQVVFLGNLFLDIRRCTADRAGLPI